MNKGTGRGCTGSPFQEPLKSNSDRKPAPCPSIPCDRAGTHRLLPAPGSSPVSPGHRTQQHLEALSAHSIPDPLFAVTTGKINFPFIRQTLKATVWGPNKVLGEQSEKIKYNRPFT